MIITVELDVFNGRPNPTWTLKTEESVKPINMLKSLPPVDNTPTEDGLGYRGFVLSIHPEVMDSKGMVKDLPTSIRIFQGVIFMGGDKTTSYRDIHNIEKKLIIQAKQKGYSSIVDNI